MCGIVAILNTTRYEDSVKQTISALERMEYRGYDSSGIAFIDKEHTLHRICSVGKINNLYTKCSSIDGTCSAIVGHTRWATHGIVTVENAHPQVTGNIAIVHNGIIENYNELKNIVNEPFTSNTDSEIISQLIFHYMKTGMTFKNAFLKTITMLEGSYAVAAICSDCPTTMLGAKKGSPLVVGSDQNHIYMASDAVALSQMTPNITYLEENDVIVAEQGSFQILENGTQQIHRNSVPNTISTENIDKGEYEDFMIKEINEEPAAVSNAYNKFKCSVNIEKYSTIHMIACGSSHYVCILAKYIIEKQKKIRIITEIASEFRYRCPVLNKDTLYVFVSQSGETSDTLGAMRLVLSQNMDTLAIVNVQESSIAREAKHCIYTNAGVEIGVASTKTFVSQLVTLLLTAGIDIPVMEVCKSINKVLNNTKNIFSTAQTLIKHKTLLFIGRGVCYPIAMEGALKIKEITYTPTEGYPSGEIKHGPIAIVDNTVCSVVIAINDDLYEKTMSNMEEIKARGGNIVTIGYKSNNICIDDEEMPSIFASITAVHMLAYYAAKLKNLDVDKPRNLAKSVTVE